MRTAVTVAEFRKATNEALKKAGLTALNGTLAYPPAMRLTAALARLGVFVVPVGELESRVPSIPSGDKAKWLTQVFEEGHHLRPNDHLKTLCTQIRTYLQNC
ncbi:hypothetical protein [Streptomyces lavendulae]